MGYQKSKQKMPPKKLMTVIKTAVPMLGVLACIDDCLEPPIVLANPKGSHYDMSVHEYPVLANPKGSHYDIYPLTAKLMLQSVNACNLNQFMSEGHLISEVEFLMLIRMAETKITYFFNTGAETIDDEQWIEKKDELLSNLTTMIENPNTVTFIIAKASTKGNMIKNREISTKRATHMQSRIDELLKSEGVTFKCTQMYRTYVSAKLFQIDPEHAQLMRNDVKRARYFNEKLDDYVNQSVVVLTYPCFREMCKFMKKDLDLSCEEMLEGCKEVNHCK